jgi:hypothetical protein
MNATWSYLGLRTTFTVITLYTLIYVKNSVECYNT